jgi:cysteinyl-tRNA synthetase
MDDDLNISAALAALFDFIREVNNYLDKNRVSTQEAKRIFNMVIRFDEALGVIGEVKKQENLSKEAEELIRCREEARHSKDWKEADMLREQLKAMGVIIEDTAQGVKWHIEKH